MSLPSASNLLHTTLKVFPSQINIPSPPTVRGRLKYSILKKEVVDCAVNFFQDHRKFTLNGTNSLQNAVDKIVEIYYQTYKSQRTEILNLLVEKSIVEHLTTFKSYEDYKLAQAKEAP